MSKGPKFKESVVTSMAALGWEAFNQPNGLIAPSAGGTAPRSWPSASSPWRAGSSATPAASGRSPSSTVFHQLHQAIEAATGGRFGYIGNRPYFAPFAKGDEIGITVGIRHKLEPRDAIKLLNDHRRKLHKYHTQPRRKQA